MLIDAATLPGDVRAAARETARRLVVGQRGKTRRGGLEGLVQEYSLSS